MKNFIINIAAIIGALAIVVGLGMGIRTGKKKESEISYYKAYYQEKAFGYGEQKEKDILSLVTNVNKLKALCEEYENPAFDESSQFYSDAVPAKIREYDDKFFENKALIIYMKWGSSSYNRLILDNLYLEDDYLVLRRYLGKTDVVEAHSCWLYFLVVNKKDIGNATTIYSENIGLKYYPTNLC